MPKPKQEERWGEIDRDAENENQRDGGDLPPTPALASPAAAGAGAVMVGRRAARVSAARPAGGAFAISDDPGMRT